MSTQVRRRLAAWSTVLGALLAAISCTSMIAATIAGPLGRMGIAVTSGRLADTLDQFMWPVIHPLLIVSLAFVIIGLAPRGRVPLALAVVGSVLVYLAMFVLPSGAAAMLQMGMSTTEPEPLGLVVFWLGVVVIGAGFTLAYRRQGVTHA